MLYLIIPPIIVVASLALLVYFFSKKYQEIDLDALNVDDQEFSQGDAHDYRDKTKRSFDVIISLFNGMLQVIKDIFIAVFGALSSFTAFLWNKMTSFNESRKSKAEHSLPIMKDSLKSKPYVAEEEADATSMDYETVSSESPQKFQYKRKQSFQSLEKKTSVSKDDNLETFVRRRKPQIEISEPFEEIQEKKAVRPMISRKQTQPEKKKVESAPVKNQLEDILIERIAANPRDIEAYERLGEYYMEQNNLQDAKECYRQVLRLSPVHRLAKIKIRKLERLLEQR